MTDLQVPLDSLGFPTLVDSDLRVVKDQYNRTSLNAFHKLETMQESLTNLLEIMTDLKSQAAAILDCLTLQRQEQKNNSPSHDSL